MSLSYLSKSGTTLDADATKIALLEAMRLLLQSMSGTSDLTATNALLTTIDASLNTIESSTTSKISRIKGAADYSMTLTYDLVGTQNILTVTHIGTTAIGIETIIETITYVDPTVNGSPITTIVYS